MAVPAGTDGYVLHDGGRREVVHHASIRPALVLAAAELQGKDVGGGAGETNASAE
eukprot:CAMPEP_0174966584 /NCGR_PEP_ID=MMETSP0004_2-20121128/7104_1 /TAXON_ID=420556 /ORGANISM="Ochromonas sp., Strain CCMP1393" /LENGTH=54 /DNA_ID=CAMNT_0016215611 /DNA_START=333 /DNA_END=497 /DNA_ORIENTATION=+